jgi:hypothetical protein
LYLLSISSILAKREAPRSSRPRQIPAKNRDLVGDAASHRHSRTALTSS